jgi:hypothetical protein
MILVPLLRNRFSRILRLLSALVFLVTLANLSAQVAGTGTIQGTVTDSTGAVVPGATITLVEANTKVTRKGTTDSGGAYVFPNIDIGNYSITVSYAGFQTYTKTGNVLEVGSNIAVNVGLTVGTQDQKIEVQADGLALQTEDVSFKQTIDSKEVTEMPLNGRRMTDLIGLSGGSAPAPGGDFTGSKYSYQTIAVSIAGSGGNTTQWKLDGGDNNDYMSNGNLPFPFPDAVNQFSVESSALGAQSGEHSGGLVNVVTRSGTNKYHGTAFEFLRNNLINADGYFSHALDSLHENQYGGTFGGPIRRDKLFGFAGYQRTVITQSQAPVTVYVPTAANLAGDFSQSDPITTTVGSNTKTICGAAAQYPGQLCNSLTGTLLPNNQINPALFSPQAVKLASYLPKATQANGYATYQIPSQTYDNEFISRIDWTINQKNNFYGRYFIDGYQAPPFFFPNNILVTTQSGNFQRVQSLVLGEDFAISAKTVNSAHITVSRRRNNRGYAANDINAATLGVNAYQAVPNGLYLAVTNKFTIGGGTNSVSHYNDNFLAVEDEVTMLRGKHQIVIGGEIVHNQLNILGGYESNGVFTFGGQYSAGGPNTTTGTGGDNNLDFLLGAMSAYEQSKFQQNALRGNVPSLYVQDTFHANKQLTVVAGIRWAPEFLPVDYFNRGSTFNMANFLANKVSAVYPTAPAGVMFYGDPGVPRQFSQNSPWQFAPNLGVAYDVTGNGKMVIRAGAEFLYDEVNFFTGQRVQQNPPFASAIKETQTATSGPLSFAAPYSNGSLTTNPFPQPPIPSAANAQFFAQSQYIFLPNRYHPSSTMQWTLSIQRQFAHGWQLQVDYIGNKTSHVPLGLPISPAVYIPGFQNAAGTGCGSLVLTGPAAKASASGTPCSTTANQTQRFALTIANPAQGNQFTGGGGGSVLVGDSGTGNYNGIVTTVQHRLSQSFSLLANHTWSKCLNEEDAQGDLAGTTVENPANPRQDYAPCGSDYRHIANFVLVVESKFPIANRFVANLANGWELAPLGRILSGSPFTVTSGVDWSFTDVGNDRPNLVPGVDPYLHQPIHAGSTSAFEGYLNSAAFAPVCPTGATPTTCAGYGTYGNIGRNSFRGRTAYQFDAQLSRIFPIHESLNATLRFECFNVLNHPNFSNPTSTLSSSTFGLTSSVSNAARIFQISGKVNF